MKRLFVRAARAGHSATAGLGQTTPGPPGPSLKVIGIGGFNQWIFVYGQAL